MESMLGDLDRMESGDVAIELAIWFHDVVYDPKSRDNEALSARFFEIYLALWLDSTLSDNVVRLILATDYSQERSGRPDEDLIRDIDLAILAADPADYLVYAEAIRREYGHVPDSEFVAGRRAILKRFLAGRIYFTDGFSAFESFARRNIESEIELLGIDLESK
ncbi:MAG: metal-dependent phosphohydrolase [Luteolibacter sp.]